MASLKCGLFLFIILVAIRTGLAQDETDTVSPDELLTMAEEPLICQTCKCLNETVDCTKRNLKRSFTLEEWDGLKPLNPITVDLSSNSLQTLATIGTLPIQNLIVTNSDLELVEDHAFKNLEKLVNLDLSYNKLATASLSRRIFEQSQPPDPPRTLKSLRKLNLAHNDIYSLPQELFESTPELIYLDLSGNPLAYIDQLTMAVLADLSQLRELYLSGCDLETLPEGLFRRLRRLIVLDLSDNRFTTIPSIIGEAANLERLNFNKNPIVTLEQGNALTTLTKLQELSLCRLSRLQSITEGGLANLASLTSLKISYNPRLSLLDPGFLMWTDDMDVERYPRLEKFYLNGNGLSYIDSQFLDRWDTIKESDFTNNPYNCDCKAQWMVVTLIPLLQNSGSGDQVQDMICKKPDRLRGQSFAKLQESSEQLKCNEKLTSAQTDGAILLGIMIGIFTAFPIVIILVLLWKKGAFRKCRRRVSRDKYDYDEEDNL